MIKRLFKPPNHSFFLFGPPDIGKHPRPRTFPQNLRLRICFEHFVLIEWHRLANFRQCDWSFSYFQTTDGGEIDLVIDRPSKTRLLVEIKSTNQVTERDVSALNRFQKGIPHSEAFCLSLDPTPKKIGATLCLPWQQTLQKGSPFF